MIRWEEDELILIAMFQNKSRKETIGELGRVIPRVTEEEMRALVKRTSEKVELMTDSEFQHMDLEAYWMEPVEAV